ncbi:hypothetical protein NDU88_001627 [Pleurodeles waltl]|uniref:Uncharacterized protein n=1 Tax=Pleurodeles waltl TaxID=8319 RepID=A0AAV7MN84_PLEWA|nr:hypothetical protein NDU88_001627 [Pleurodeles waltl]
MHTLMGPRAASSVPSNAAQQATTLSVLRDMCWRQRRGVFFGEPAECGRLSRGLPGNPLFCSAYRGQPTSLGAVAGRTDQRTFASVLAGAGQPQHPILQQKKHADVQLCELPGL